jgi:hypothetical protein
MTAHMSSTSAYRLEDWIDTSNVPNDPYVTVSVHSMNLNVGKVGADSPVSPSEDSMIQMSSLSTAAAFTPSNVSLLPASSNWVRTCILCKSCSLLCLLIVLNSLIRMFDESHNSPESYWSDNSNVTQVSRAILCSLRD